jgi:hypothetical protein
LPLALARDEREANHSRSRSSIMNRASMSRAAACLTCLALATRATAQTASPHSGSWLVGGGAALTRDRNSQAGGTTTHAALDPTGLRFVNAHLALGGAMVLGYDGFPEGRALTYGIGPAARYYPLAGAPWQPFLAVSVAPEWQSISQDGFPTNHISLLGADGSLGLTRMLATHVGLDGALFYRHQKQTNRTSSARVSWTEDDYGVRFGLSVFLR